MTFAACDARGELGGSTFILWCEFDVEVSRLQNSRELDSAMSQNYRTVGFSGLPGPPLGLGLGPDPGNPISDACPGASDLLYILFVRWGLFPSGGRPGTLGGSGAGLPGLLGRLSRGMRGEV